MSRLIDADELLKEFDPDGERLDPIFVRSRIVRQPIAFDTEKVVEQLESLSNAEADYYYARSNDVIDREDAIDIVKKGGVE